MAVAETLEITIAGRTEAHTQVLENKVTAFRSNREALESLDILFELRNSFRAIKGWVDKNATYFESEEPKIVKKIGALPMIKHGTPVASVSLVWKTNRTNQIKVYVRRMGSKVEVFNSGEIQKYTLAEFQEQRGEILRGFGLDFANSQNW